MFSQIIINSLISGAIYALLALGFNLIYNSTKFFNLSHGTVGVAGGYVVYGLAQLWGWNFYLSLLIGLLSAGALGWFLNYFVFSALRRQKASNMTMLVASLGLFTILQALITIIFSSQFQILNQSLPQIYSLANASITQIQIIIILVTLLVAGALLLLLKKTLFGKMVRALSDDEGVAKIVGLNTEKIIGWVFFIGSAIAGLAFIFQGLDSGLEPSLGLGLLLKGVIAAIIGGVGNVYGSFVGAFLLAFVENFGIWKIAAEWKDAIAFALLVIFLLFRPQGLMKR